MAEPLITLRDVSRWYRRGADVVHALERVSLAIEGGLFVALMGPSGSGKSTLLNLLSGIDRPSAGEVWVADPDEHLLPDMSVRVNFLAEAEPATPGGAVVLVPRAALRRDDREAYVWVVRDGRAHRQPVATGAELGDQVHVTAGLTGGETLVSGDATGVSDGAAVRVEAKK